MISSHVRRSFEEIVKKRRVHVWAAYYFIGVWTLTEPMITLFGFSDAKIELSRNLGLAFFPLVLFIAWFHGEPGRQMTSRTEVLTYLLGGIGAFLIYTGLSSKPYPFYTVITPHSSEQNRWLHEHVISDFEEEFQVRIELRSVQENYDDHIWDELTAPTDSFTTILVKAPLHTTGRLLRERDNLISSFDDLLIEQLGLRDSQVQDFLAQFVPYSLRFGKKQTSDEKLYFLPSEFQIMVMAYSKSKVAEAVQHWAENREEISSAILGASGQALPFDYALESDPNLWDILDLLVAGWYWSHQEYDGEVTGRLASPCANDLVSFSRILDTALSHGATLDEVYNLALNKDGIPADAMVEMFCWEAIFRQNGLYYPGMWLGNGLTEPEIIEIMSTGKVFMSPVSNYAVHRLVESNPDIEVATMPAGVSLAGQRARKRGFSQLWFWTVPALSPSPGLSCELAKLLTEKETQVKVAQEYSLIPTRIELLAGEHFGDSATRSTWNVFKNQIEINKKGLRDINPYKDATNPEPEILLNFYYTKWHEIMMGEPFTNSASCNKDVIKGLLMI